MWKIAKKSHKIMRFSVHTYCGKLVENTITTVDNHKIALFPLYSTVHRLESLPVEM